MKLCFSEECNIIIDLVYYAMSFTITMLNDIARP